MTITMGIATRRFLAVVLFSATALSGCAWGGVNSLPLPGAPGRVSGAARYHVEITNVGSLESNSPVMIGDVVVGSVGAMTVHDWHADVEILVKPGVAVPANAVASIGQTSLLGSSHLALNPPLGVAPSGHLAPGATIPLSKSSIYPSTEQTLASVSVVVNGGGLGQLGDIIANFNAAFSGHQDAIRDLITRLDRFVGTFDNQRDDVIALIHALNRLAATVAGQRDVVTAALNKVPPALDVLLAERPRLTTALEKLRVFSDTSTWVVNAVQADLVENLRHLEPTFRSLADVGIDLDKALAFTTVFPYGQACIDRCVKGDYINLSTTLDLTVPRLKRELLLGTRWADPSAQIQAAVGDPGYAEQTNDPLSVGLAPPAPAGDTPASPAPGAPAPTATPGGR
jgi:phospholipid/cholesterol/gamma-HCH transport system substrate-binding protein